MAEELLDTNQGVQEDAGAVEETSSEKKTFSQDEILAKIEGARAAAKVEAEAAFTRSQSLVDKNIARIQQATQSQLEALMERTGRVLAEHGAEPETIEGLRRQTQTDLEMTELRRQAQAYQELRSQTEAEQEREKFIAEQCRKYNVSPYDERLNRTDPYAFADSILAIREERLARQAKDQDRKGKQEDLERLAQAGALDVTGGGAAMAAPAWSTSKLVLGSDEFAISEELLRKFAHLTPAEMGRLIMKTQQLMKQEPNLPPRQAAQRVAMQELQRI